MTINTGLDKKLGLFESLTKKTYSNSWHILYFYAMFVEVQDRIFFESDNFPGNFIDFFCMMFTQVLIK